MVKCRLSSLHHMKLYVYLMVFTYINLCFVLLWELSGQWKNWSYCVFYDWLQSGWFFFGCHQSNIEYPSSSTIYIYIYIYIYISNVNFVIPKNVMFLLSIRVLAWHNCRYQLCYNDDNAKNTFTFGLNVAENTHYMKKWIKVVLNWISYKKVPELMSISPPPRVEPGSSKDWHV